MIFNSQNTLSISYETMRKIANVVDQHELTNRRWGRREADKKHTPKGAGVRTTRPLERVEIDHFLIDVFLLISYQGGFHVQRPWLTLAIDHYAGTILGYHLSFAPPSSSSVLAVLRKAILPKGEPPSLTQGKSILLSPDDPFNWPLAERWPCYGLPDYIAVDNGLDFTSNALKDACFRAGIEILYCPPRVPWYKGTIESFGRTINVKLIHWLPGTTLGKPLKNIDYDAKKDACILIEDFERLLEHYIVEIHNHTARRRKPGSPLNRWLKGIAEFPPRMPISAEEFDAAISLTKSCTLSINGITHLGRDYNNTQLGILFNRMDKNIKNKKGKKNTVTVKINPLDLTYVYVHHPVTDELVRVECTTLFEYPPTLEYHKAVLAVAKQEGFDPGNAIHLTVAHEKLQAEIAEATVNGKNAMRRMKTHYANLASRNDTPESISSQRTSKQQRHDDLKDLLSSSKRIA